MRHIGTLPDEPTARRFGDYLLLRGIPTNVEPSEGHWSVWVYDEDKVATAREELAAFSANPRAPQYLDAEGSAADVREATIRKGVEARKNVVNVRDRWRAPATASCPITLIMIFISLLVAGFTRVGSDNEQLISRIQIAPQQFVLFDIRLDENGKLIPPPRLKNVREGEVWRLVTPIFLHLSVMHVVFNMMMLYQFGMMVEFRIGSWRYLLLVLAIAVVSNIAQYWFVSPNFGGMSGVNYGLFGYIWMKSHFDPRSGYFLPQSTVTIMMAWYLLCVFNVIEHVANWAHGAGLLVGVLVGVAGVASKSLRTGRGSRFQS